MSTTTLESHENMAGLNGNSRPEAKETPPADEAQIGQWQMMYSFVATRPLSLGAASILAALSALIGLIPYLILFAIALQILSNRPDMDEVLLLAGAAVACAFLKQLLFALSTSLSHAAAFGIQYDLRMRLARKMANVPMGFFSKHRTSNLHKAMSEDVNGLEAFIAHMLPDAVAALSIPLSAMALMFAVDWRMALASFMAVPIAIIFQISMFRGDVKQSYAQYHEVTAATKSAVHNYLRGLHVIKAFGLEARSFKELRLAVDAMTDYVETYARRSAPPMIAAMKLIGGGTNALFIIPVGVWLYSKGTLDLATFVFFLVVSPQVLSPFLRISNAAGQLQVLLNGAQNIHELLSEPLLEQGLALPLPKSREIQFKNVTFAYEEEAVLREINLELRPGTVTALVGPSGAGKSTLARLIARFWDVSSGQILVGGEALRHLDLDLWLQQVALVFQDVFLFEGSVLDNLKLAKPQASKAELIQACKLARIHDVIEALPQGYDTALGERGARLSGGERQRISIARAFLKDAPILILDEATAFADPLSESQIQDALSELATDKTVLVIAHKLTTIKNADNIAVLERGQIIDSGKHENLLNTCPTYQNLWESYSNSMTWKLGDAQEVQS